jgi:acyl-CoA dehydrogenase
VRSRQAFGATLWDQQTIRQRIACWTKPARRGSSSPRAWAVTRGHGIVPGGVHRADEVELVNEVPETCQQFHGGMNYP